MNSLGYNSRTKAGMSLLVPLTRSIRKELIMPKTTVTKRCSACKTFKPLLDFCKNKSQPDGHHSDCRVCKKTYQRAYQSTEAGKAVNRRGQAKYRTTAKGIARQEAYYHKEGGNAIRKAYSASELGKASQRRSAAKRKERYPEKFKARDAVRNAIVTGKLPRPDTFICSCKKRTAQEYHHPSYAPEHWLDVLPRCLERHRKLHKKVKVEK